MAPERATWWRGLALVTGGLLVAGLVLASVRPSPYLAEWALLPRPLGEWADRHPELRHLAAYAAVTTAVGWAFRQGMRRWCFVAVGLAFCAVSLEFSQRLVPGRTSDWRDVAWSLLGCVLGAAIGAVLARLASLREGAKA